MARVEGIYPGSGLASAEILGLPIYRVEEKEGMQKSPWENSIVYQAYPSVITTTPQGEKKPFLQSLRTWLSHIKSLNTDAIWISPIYPSSGADSGYDITNYCAIDPKFGTMDDFDQLVAQAESLNMSIFMDLVFHHVSSEHPWYQQARSSSDNPYRNWFIFRRDNLPNLQGKWTKEQPVFRKEHSGEYVLGSFSEKQIDLNLRNRDVQEAHLQTLDFWRFHGVKGWRIDVADSLDKDDSLYDPSLPLSDSVKLKSGPRLFSREGFLASLSRYAGDKEGLILEVGEDMPPPEYLKEFQEVGANMIPFDFIHKLPWSAREYKNYIDNLCNRVDRGRIAIALSSHDISRVNSRLTTPQADAAWVMLSMLGTVFVIYNGDELGMLDQPKPQTGFVDPLDRYKSRGEIQSNLLNTSTSKQKLSKLGQLLQLKKSLNAVVNGRYERVETANERIFGYGLSDNQQSILVLTNFSSSEQTVKIPGLISGRVKFSTHKRDEFLLAPDELKFNPNEALVIELITSSL